MPRTLRRLATALALAAPLSPTPARADEAPPRDPAVAPAALGAIPKRTTVPPRGSSAHGEAKSTAAPGWWIGPAGVAGALAVVGGLSLASRRWNLNLPLGAGSARDAGLMQVVGHARLGPKQSVYLLRVGRRVLILGAGPGGSPASLGEVTDPAELDRLLPPGRPSAKVAPGAVARAGRPATGFDHRIGDDE